MHFLLGPQVLVASNGTIVDERDGVLRVLGLQWKQVAHGLNWHEDAGVGAVISVLAYFGYNTNHVEANTIQQDAGTHCWPPREHVLEQLPTNDCDPAALRVVFIIEPATGTDRDVADLVINGRNPEHLAVGAAVITYGADIFPIQHRRDDPDELRIITDREIVLVCEVI